MTGLQEPDGPGGGEAAVPGAPAKRKGRRIAVGLIAAAAVVALAAVGIAWVNGFQADKALSADRVFHSVPVAIVAPDYNSQTDSKFPVSVVGIDVDGQVVDRCYFLTPDQNRIPLAEGSYKASVKASPLLADGNLYRIPAKTYYVSVSDQGRMSKPLRFTFEKLAPESISDEMIDLAYDQALFSGEDEQKVESSKAKIAASRQAALDAAAAAEAERKQAEAKDSGSSSEETARKTQLASLLKPWDDRADELKANFDKNSNIYYTDGLTLVVSELHLGYLPSGEVAMRGKLRNNGDTVQSWWLDVWTYNADGTGAYARFDNGTGEMNAQEIKTGEEVEFTLRLNQSYDTGVSPRDYASFRVGELTITRQSA